MKKNRLQDLLVNYQVEFRIFFDINFIIIFFIGAKIFFLENQDPLLKKIQRRIKNLSCKDGPPTIIIISIFKLINNIFKSFGLLHINKQHKILATF